jgi:hypothetical protein
MKNFETMMSFTSTKLLLCKHLKDLPPYMESSVLDGCCDRSFKSGGVDRRTAKLAPSSSVLKSDGRAERRKEV